MIKIFLFLCYCKECLHENFRLSFLPQLHIKSEIDENRIDPADSCTRNGR